MTARSNRRYDVAMALTFYRPYVSGLSEAARLIAEGLARKGLRVAVATTKHERSLPRTETIGGVDVFRAPVLTRLNKGTISPGFIPLVRRLSSISDVLNVHLPMLEGGIVSRISLAPVVVTYQCDVALSSSVLDRFIVRVMDSSSRMAIRHAETTVFSSEDYRESSRNAPADSSETESIRPPFVDRSGGKPLYRETKALHVGFLGRIVAEKGLGWLLNAFAEVADPDARLLVGGEYERVSGGSVIGELRPKIERDTRVRLLGFIPDERLPDFYASIDVLALPSVSSLEAYGIVQLEAMSAGVPVVASDRPGVRVPVRDFGWGMVVPQGDVHALCEALSSLPHAERAYDMQGLAARFEKSDPVDAYLRLFEKLRSTKGGKWVERRAESR